MTPGRCGMGVRVIYDEGLTDSRRWDGLELRPDDIVISTPSKCGTTWLQMICALLIFGTPDLPAPLTVLSPWLDMKLRPREDVYALLRDQRHRRFIKTHTPLDGLPTAEGVTYLVMGRDPRDVAISMDNHRANLNEDVITRGLQRLDPDGTSDDTPTRRKPVGPRERVLDWMNDDTPTTSRLSSLRGMVSHLAGAWQRREDDNVILLHYAAMSADLPGHLAMIATRLGVAIPERLWPPLLEAATLPVMRSRASQLVPDEHMGLLRDLDRFFHSDSIGQWQQLLTAQDLAHYRQRLNQLAPPDLIDWIHQPVQADATPRPRRIDGPWREVTRRW